jgi:hypothetical protein
MIPGLPTSLQGPFCVGVCAVLSAPLCIALLGTQQQLKQQATAKAQQQAANTAAVEAIAQESDQNTRIGLERAKDCSVVDPATPIGQNTGRVKFKGKNIFLPTDTNICDRNGFTAVQGPDRLEDVRPIDASTLKTALQARNPR